MSNLNISLDMDRVQSSVQAVIRPAVEAALASQDLKKVIEKALKSPLHSDEDEDSIFTRFSGRSRSKTSLLDELVHSGIQEIAKQYVAVQLREQQGDIEEAFRKMMAGSSSRLVKAFAAATEAALKEDWGFELDVKVSHTTSESDDD